MAQITEIPNNFSELVKHKIDDMNEIIKIEIKQEKLDIPCDCTEHLLHESPEISDNLLEEVSIHHFPLIKVEPLDYLNNLTSEVHEEFIKETNGIISLDSTRYQDENTEYRTWTQAATKILILLFKENKVKLGTFEIRNMKKLWQKISTEMVNKYEINVNANNCENRWRVLERNYKKTKVNKNKAGRGGKYFEYSNEMDEIFKKKRNINPEILLSSDTPVTVTCLEEIIPAVVMEDAIEDVPKVNVKTVHSKYTEKRKWNKSIRNKNKTLGEMKNDRKKYYKELLDLKRSYMKEKMEIELQILNEKKRKNEILSEMSDSMKRFLTAIAPTF